MAKKKKPQMNRRQFLVGSGGFLLSLPFLPSLVPNAMASTGQKRFIALFSGHGQAFAHWLPTNDSVNLRAINGFREVRGMSLAGIRSGGQNQISRVIGSEFNPYRSDLLLLTRLTPPRGSGQHHTSQMLGGATKNLNPNTIDQIMARSSAVTAGTPERVLNMIAVERGQYYSNSSMIRRDGNDLSSLIGDPRVAFDKLFCQNGSGGGGNPDPQPTPEVDYDKKVVDKVLGHYRSVINNNRLSNEDKQKLQQYVDNLNDLENRLFPERTVTSTNPVQSVSSCPARPTFQSVPLSGNSGMDRLMKNNIDVIALAIKSGMTNIATLQFHPHDYHASNFGDIHPQLNQDTHNGIGHSSGEAKWRLNHYFGLLMVRLLDELSQVENSVTGETYLNNSLVFWGNDQGCYNNPGNHGHKNMPVLLAGQAGGALTTGRLIDYGPNYNDGAFLRAPDTYGQNGYREGRVYNQLLVTLLQAMGVAPSEYESSPGSGFGAYGNDSDWSISGESNDGVTDKRAWLPGVRGESIS